MGARCPRCRFATAPPTPRCPACGTTNEEVLFPASGVVWSVTQVMFATPGAEPGRQIAYVDIVDGPRVVATIRPANMTRPDRTHADPIRADLIQIGQVVSIGVDDDRIVARATEAAN